MATLEEKYEIYKLDAPLTNPLSFEEFSNVMTANTLAGEKFLKEEKIKDEIVVDRMYPLWFNNTIFNKRLLGGQHENRDIVI